MSTIVADAKQLLLDVDLFKAPINPIEVCEKYDIIYDEKPYGGFDGTLMVYGTKQLIGVNSNIRHQGRKSFTCAHEIGHYYYDLNDLQTFKCTRDDTGYGKLSPSDKREIRANAFASELLMPQELFTKELDNQEPSWALIEQVANKFGSSLQAAARRFVNLTHHTCWLVVMKDGVKQSFTKADHNEFAVELSGKFQAPKKMPTDWQTMQADSWLYSSRKTRDKEILCWPRLENQFGESLVLLWDEGDALREEEYENEDTDDGDDDDKWGRRTWRS